MQHGALAFFNALCQAMRPPTLSLTLGGNGEARNTSRRSRPSAPRRKRLCSNPLRAPSRSFVLSPGWQPGGWCTPLPAQTTLKSIPTTTLLCGKPHERVVKGDRAQVRRQSSSGSGLRHPLHPECRARTGLCDHDDAVGSSPADLRLASNGCSVGAVRSTSCGCRCEVGDQ